MGDHAVIECRNIWVRYGEVTVLEDVSFSVPEREILCLVGPNGGGKSTLLKVLLGLVQPHQGQVSVLGCDPKSARSRIGYMPQHVSIDPLFPISVDGIVQMGRLSASGFSWRIGSSTKNGL